MGDRTGEDHDARRRTEVGVSRRALLLGATGGLAALGVTGWLVEQDVLPGRSRGYRLLGLNGAGTPFPDDLPPGELVRGSFSSVARGGAEVPYVLAYPAGVPTDAPLPVVLALHGASGDEETPFDTMAIDRYLSAYVADGGTPFAVAAAYGALTYWRPQPDGTDASLMLTEEFLPLLAERGLRTDRIGLYGWSMGGYGSLRLAGLQRAPVVAAAVSSPALAEMDLASDPDEIDVFGHPERLGDVPLRIDIGRGDPFYPVVADFEELLTPEPEGSVTAGGHTPQYWRGRLPFQIDFLGRFLG